MAPRFRAWDYAHFFFWSALAAASLAISAPKIDRGMFAYSLRPTGPLHSSDSFLRFAAGAPEASEKLIATFQALPPSQTVLILTHKDDPFSSNLGMTTAYLASPHPVRFVEIDGKHVGDQLTTIDRTNLAAVVLCRVSRPSWMPPGKIFGSGFEIVTRAQRQ